MKNYFLNFAFILLILGIGVGSCNKNDQNQINGQLFPFFSLYYNIDSLLNNSQIGVEHNEYLDDVLNLASFPNHTLSDLYLLSQSYHPVIFSDSLITISGINSQDFIDSIVEYTHLGNGLNDVAIYYYTNEVITEQVYDKLIELHDAINCSATLEQFDNGNIDSFLNSVCEIIISINSLPVSTFEKKLVTHTCEIAYYSSIYWLDVLYDEGNAWHEPIFSEAYQDPIPRWKKVLIGAGRLTLDVVGFASGSLGSWFVLDKFDAIENPSYKSAFSIGLGGICAKEASSWIKQN
jgi:hypothetical protein